MSIKTFVVHPWSGTVLDADDGVIMVKINEVTATDMTDEEIVAYAQLNGVVI